MERVRAYAEMIGVEMGLNETELNQLRWGTLLHDIGKLRVPTRILQKPRAISVWLEEFVRSRTHMT